MGSIKTQYGALYNKEIGQILELVKSNSDVLDDESRALIEEYQDKNAKFFANIQNIFSKKFIIVKARVNNNGRTVYDYISSKMQVGKELETLVKLLSPNYIFVKTPEKIFNRMNLDLPQWKFLPGSATRVCDNIAKSVSFKVNDIIFAEDPEYLKKATSSDQSIFNFEDYEIAGAKIPGTASKEESLMVFNNYTETLSQVADGNHILIIKKGINYVNTDGETIIDKYDARDVNPQDLIQSFETVLNKKVFANKKSATILWGDFKRISKRYDAKKLPLWLTCIRNNITEPELIEAFDASKCHVVKDASGMFKDYLKPELEHVDKIFKTITPSKKQLQFREDLAACYEVYKEDRTVLKRHMKTIRFIAKYVNRSLYEALRTQSLSLEIDLGLAEKYPYKDLVNNYHNDNYEQVKMYLHLVDVWDK